MESRAILKYTRVTPRKVRRVADLIRGKQAGQAIVELRFMPYRAAKMLEKLLKSAMSNAGRQKGVDPETMKISRIFVDKGPVMKRMRPRAMGRANIIKKRMSHVTIHLSDNGN